METWIHGISTLTRKLSKLITSTLVGLSSVVIDQPEFENNQSKFKTLNKSLIVLLPSVFNFLFIFKLID